jgi:hypothetical protein
MALGIHAVDADARDRRIDRIVHVRFGIDREASAQHRAIARSGVDGKDQWIGLQGSNPYGIKSLVENPKRGEKPARRDRQVGIRDVVDLRVVNVLVDRATVRAAARWTLKLAFELGA